MQAGEKFSFSYPYLDPRTNEVTHLEREIDVTQIINKDEFNEGQTGVLVMRLHFLVSTYLNLYVWDPVAKASVYGHAVSLQENPRTIADKKSHLMTIDKLVAKVKVGDTFLETDDQIADKVIKQYERDEGLMISDFDGFMAGGNPFV